ncbi:type II toxin-antitoxin system VapC family toxin [Sphingobium yanoikuyae]|jgi:tRNA(fMet)-specific endonuclease VapC|uniref:Ribonuclease VapC n=1 Tax=Sphingobium yanoikuyae TaxID=13690 RepID=A0A9X7U4E3_SPHYA|nr:type II toxin-antitoxin system VapC family toxin [Sphingobium yanoikuyae]QNG43543.1 type II toxin-antitoxin system VapC family toxin [Sphingobium yanoikuyae]
MFLLDTNILSDLIRQPDGLVARAIADVGEDAIATSIIVPGEMRYGGAKRGSARLQGKIDQLLSLIPVLPLKNDANASYGRLRAELERRGTPIGADDMLIAAHAFAVDATLVTDNIREFERVDGLKLVNWLRTT